MSEYADVGWVYKICPRSAWLVAQATGELPMSVDDARDGFVHLSLKRQLLGTLHKHFASQRDLVLLSIRVERLPAEKLRWEASGGGQHFPHLYVPLRASWVSRATAIADGTGAASARLPRDF